MRRLINFATGHRAPEAERRRKLTHTYINLGVQPCRQANVLSYIMGINPSLGDPFIVLALFPEEHLCNIVLSVPCVPACSERASVL